MRNTSHAQRKSPFDLFGNPFIKPEQIPPVRKAA